MSLTNQRFRIDEAGGLRLLLLAVRDGHITVEQALECFSDEPPAPPVQVPDVSADLSQYGFAFVLVRPGGATYRIDPLDVTLQKFPDQPENRTPSHE